MSAKMAADGRLLITCWLTLLCHLLIFNSTLASITTHPSHPPSPSPASPSSPSVNCSDVICHNNGICNTNSSHSFCQCKTAFGGVDCQMYRVQFLLHLHITSEQYMMEYSDVNHTMTQKLWRRLKPFLFLSLISSNNRHLNGTSTTLSLMRVTSGSVLVKCHVTLLSLDESIRKMTLTMVAAAVQAGAAVAARENRNATFTIDSVTPKSYDYCTRDTPCKGDEICSLSEVTFECSSRNNSSGFNIFILLIIVFSLPWLLPFLWWIIYRFYLFCCPSVRKLEVHQIPTYATNSTQTPATNTPEYDSPPRYHDNLAFPRLDVYYSVSDDVVGYRHHNYLANGDGLAETAAE